MDKNKSKIKYELDERQIGDEVKETSVQVVATDGDNQTNERENWTGKMDFFFASLGYAVGLGAVWRFPYLCYRHGGGAFLIPYVIFLLLIGIPLVFLEMSVGQFTSSGPMTCWVCVPLFRGIGFAMNLVNQYLNVYYNMILAYSLYFLVLSFRAQLAWQHCDPTWSSSNCVDDYSASRFYFTKCLSNDDLKCNNGQCFNRTLLFLQLGYNVSTCEQALSLFNNDSITYPSAWWNPNFPSQDFWNKMILKSSSSIDETGVLVWQLVLSLFGAWLIVFLMLVNGINVSGKLAYFTAIFPYVILLILGIRGWLLEGANVGIKFYIYPDFNKLKDYTVWTDAATQIFFTLSVCYGGLMALSSYNKFNHNILRDSVLISLGNCLTSVFAGFVVFSYMGYLAHKTGQSIDEVIQAGQGLAYVVYPYAVTTIPGAPFWAIMFFLMMLVLGLDTMMAGVETLITSMFDILPFLKRTKLRRVLTISAICLMSFATGLIFCTQSGTYWIEIFDAYSGNWAILVLGIIECVCMTWLYGFERFRADIASMLGERVVYHWSFNIWKILWTFVTPIILIVLVTLSILSSKRLGNEAYTFPYWTEVFGNCMSASILALFLLIGVLMIIRTICLKRDTWRSLIRPSVTWRPRKEEDVRRVLEMHNEHVIKNMIVDKSGVINENFSESVTKI